MTRIEGEALVLRVVEHGESDLIVRLLHPERGRLTAIAKGARRSVRRFPGTLDVFNLLRVVVRRRRNAGMGFLEQARLVTAHLELRREAGRYALASYLLELLDRMAPEEAHAGDAGLGGECIVEGSEDRLLRPVDTVRVTVDAASVREVAGRDVHAYRLRVHRATGHIEYLEQGH